jgi:type I restriction enzyme R subunit
VEEAALACLSELGWACAYGPTLAPEGAKPERAANTDVLLEGRLRGAISRLNPTLGDDAHDEVLRRLKQVEKPSLVEENRRLHGYLVAGVPIEVQRADGTIGGELVRLVDFDDPTANDWLAVNQVTVVEQGAKRRADVVLFVNGLPLAVLELKNPGAANAKLEGAHQQLWTYKNEIPSLFRTNAVLMISDGLIARIGSLTANLERFMPWRTVTGMDVAPKGLPELETVLQGVFDHRRFLALVRDFIVFGDTGGDLAKILAGYHQFHAVRHAVTRTVAATRPMGDRKAGVIWHTQGSGKSLLMAFYAGQVVRHPDLVNPTLVVLTDRNDLDEQLYSTFVLCQDLLRQTPERAESREALRKLLDRAAGGVIFTTIQKFAPDEGATYPTLTERRNVIVIADEAHRSQYGLSAKFAADSGEVSYGFAKYMRDALPNASFIGFTGTPIEATDVNTPAVFGEYIDIYDISRAVEDGATVPIYYESRIARIGLDEELAPELDAEFEEETKGAGLTEQEQLKARWARIEALVGAEQRIARVAQDLVDHLDARTEAMMGGKAMVVCMSRRICVALYEAIRKLRPEWHSDDDEQGVMKVVMTGAASDPEGWQPHIGKHPKARREGLAKRAKKADDPLRLVIVRDMWLTGFDAPSMHTMYIDKPMRGHGLMQAIARVNRVFAHKEAGLVVDYIGIGQSLKEALKQYSPQDQERTGIDEQVAVAKMLELYHVVTTMFPKTDVAAALGGTPMERLKALADAVEWIKETQQNAANQRTTKADKKRELRRFQDAVVALSKAYSLAAASDAARGIRDHLAFFQAVHGAILKTSDDDGADGSPAGRDLAVQQLVSRAVVSTEIVDILAAIGLRSPNIGILSDDFLEEVAKLEHKNLAVEALRKLLNDQIRSRSQSHQVESKAFSERLKDAIARYHANAITTAEIIQQLIDMAKDIRAARERGEVEGLNDEELAFYDALAENASAREVLGHEQLKVIAQELLVSLQQNVTVDWAHRESARARLRLLVKKILAKYGYPPDLQVGAVQTVLQQAEAMLGAMAG